MDIQAFRIRYDYNNVLEELVYSYVINLLDEMTSHDVIEEARTEFIK